MAEKNNELEATELAPEELREVAGGSIFSTVLSGQVRPYSGCKMGTANPGPFGSAPPALSPGFISGVLGSVKK